MSFSVPFEFHKGDRLGGILIVMPLVRGGHGDLYLVQDEEEQNRILKVIQRPDNEGEITGVEKCRAVSSHIPGLVPVLKTGKLSDGRIWYVMPAADNLAQWPDYEPDTLAGRISKGGGLPPDNVLRMADKLLKTIRELHAAGLAHCDIKPENILFLEGEPRLTDYSLLSSASSDRTINSPAGTIGFIPPEMLNNPGNYDPKACDLYALGKVVYCAWSGSDAVMFPSVPRDIPLQEIGVMLPLYMKACSGSPNERFKNAAEFASAVNEARSRLHNRALTLGKAFFHRYARILLLVLSIIILLCSFGLILLQRHAAPRKTDPLTVTTPWDIFAPDDGETSLREAIAYAQTPGGPRKISFDMKDGDNVYLSDPTQLTRNMRFALTNKKSGNPVSIILDNLSISGRKITTPEDWDGGGAVLHANTGRFTVNKGLYTDNVDFGSGGKGGAFQMKDSFLNMDGTVFQNNSAFSSGGAMNLERTHATIRNTLFQGNRVNGFGGALCLFDSSEVLLVDSGFEFNKTGSNAYYGWCGGAIQVDSSSLVYEVSDGVTIINEGNDSGCGGFLAISITKKNLSRVSGAEFRINGIMIIGNRDGRDSIASNVNDKSSPYKIFIRKTGKGILSIQAPVSDYDGQWFIEDGSLVFQCAGDFDGDLIISGGQLILDAPFTFKNLLFRLENRINDRPFINDLSRLTGGTFSVDAGNAVNGTYLLAEKAEGFDGIVSLQDASGKPAAALPVGGTVHIGDSSYAMELSEGKLTLIVRKSSGQ